MHDRLDYVYVVATSYSGTTLLSVLMNAHPEIASVGELANSLGIIYRKRKNKRYHCSCGAEIGECSYWEEVRRNCSMQGVELNLYDFKTRLDMGLGDHANRLFFGVPDTFAGIASVRNAMLWMLPVTRQRLKRTLSRNLVIARSILKASGKTIFFDSSKNVTSAFYHAKRSDINFKVIHLVRDPRGVLNSALRRDSHNDSVQILRNWRRLHGGALMLKRSLDEGSYLLVRYERLCHSTQETLDSIYRFIGVTPVDSGNTAAGPEKYHIIGNRMRRKALTGLSYDESWKDSLTGEQLALCKEITGDLGLMLDYEC